MKIEGMNFDEFIKIFDKYFENFILRVRDSKKDYNKKDKERIAYYSGIKAFVVKENKKGIELTFPINVYKLNPTGLKKASKKEIINEQTEDKQTRERKEANYRSDIGNICDAMNRLFDFEMIKITFDINFSKFDKDKIVKKFYKSIFVDFAGYIISHNKNKKTKDNDIVFKITNKNTTIYSNVTENELKNICKDFNDKVKFSLEFTPKLTTDIKEKNSSPKDIITLQCWFLRIARDISFVSGVKFIVNSNYKFKKYNTSTSLEIFSKNVKAAIEKYKSTSSGKLEKSYQQFFMLRANEMKELFEVKADEKVDYFEQEYGIYNPEVYGFENFDIDKDKTGRIDCIVYKYKLDGNKRVITDIYMIELKVNCDVILEDNGVMTHLEDINAFLKYKSDDKYKYYSYDILEKRISDRINILYKQEANFDNVSKHFYTIIGYTKESEIDNIKGMLKSLNDKDKVKSIIKEGYSINSNGKTKKYKLNKRFEGATLYDFYKQDIKECDIKFFLERNIFDEKNIGLDFEDITQEIFN